MTHLFVSELSSFIENYDEVSVLIPKEKDGFLGIEKEDNFKSIMIKTMNSIKDTMKKGHVRKSDFDSIRDGLSVLMDDDFRKYVSDTFFHERHTILGNRGYGNTSDSDQEFDDLAYRTFFAFVDVDGIAKLKESLHHFNAVQDSKPEEEFKYHNSLSALDIFITRWERIRSALNELSEHVSHKEPVFS